MKKIYQTARTTLLGSLSASGMTFIVKTGEGEIFPDTNLFGPIEIWAEHLENGVFTKREPILCLRDGDNFIIQQRATQACVQDESAITKQRTQTQYSFSSGDYISMYLSENDIEELNAKLEELDDDKAEKKGVPYTMRWYDENGDEQVVDFSDSTNQGKVIGVGVNNNVELITPSTDIHSLTEVNQLNDTDELIVYSNGVGNRKVKSSNIDNYNLIEFGNGVDGDFVVNSGSTFNCTRDMFFNNLQVNGTLNTKQWRIFVKGTLSGNGTILTDTTEGFFSASSPGGAGAAGVSGHDGIDSPNLATGFSTNRGGNGGDTGYGNGTSGSVYCLVSINKATIKYPKIGGFDLLSVKTGTGGGSGGTSGNSMSGGGGGSGGLLYMSIFNLQFNGTFSALGNNGGSGGGDSNRIGGGGGCVLVGYRSKTGSYSINVSGGTGGAGVNNGAAGSSGGAGSSYIFQV